jgi:tRNA-dihydrouridine synthase B
MKSANFNLSKTIIYAPLAGISDSPARRIAKEYGADITVSELISADGLVLGGKKTYDLAKYTEPERPFGLQLFGAKPDRMAEAAKILADMNPDFIDINFGCPAKKVVGKNGGSSILRNLKLFENIVSGIVNAVNIPVTAKMRSGWDSDSLTYIEAGKIAQECGVFAITLHPRTRAQRFGGQSDWSHIAELKEALNIPVIGNGDIRSPLDAKKMFEQTKCDAVMIGRGSFGNPWIFKSIKEYLNNGVIIPEPTPRERIELALKHFDMNIEHYGHPYGMYRMRTTFCWYIKSLQNASKARNELMKLTEPDEIKDFFYRYLDTIETRNQLNSSRSVSI